jgi:hypothetical protein
MPGDIRKKREGKEQVENSPHTQSSWGELSVAQQREILYPTEGQKSDRRKGTKTKVDIDAFFRDTFISYGKARCLSFTR